MVMSSRGGQRRKRTSKRNELLCQLHSRAHTQEHDDSALIRLILSFVPPPELCSALCCEDKAAKAAEVGGAAWFRMPLRYLNNERLERDAQIIEQGAAYPHPEDQ